MRQILINGTNRDLEDMVLRDRNHPSIFIWSIGNEVIEQWFPKDTAGANIAKELSSIIKKLDSTRPVTSACNGTDSTNIIIKSGALDLIGFNYGQDRWANFLKIFTGPTPLIGTETTSALASRGSYDMPSDIIRRWPKRWDQPFAEGNPDNTCSSYDNCSAPWGSTHEESWKLIKKYDYLSGMYIWTGFDYLGEPTPYGWPSRSSYFGIIDLAGFPKDAYYMYQSEWTNKPVLHILPHWNWKQRDSIDVWVYSSAKKVELFLNGKSLGAKQKTGDDLHLQWRVSYVPGTLKAVAIEDDKEVQTAEIKTAGDPYMIKLDADRLNISADSKDLSFITVTILDKDGNIVPKADNLVNFKIEGAGTIAGVDNGCETSMESFKANFRKAFNGKCLVVIQSTDKSGEIKLEASSDKLKTASLSINSK